MHFILNFGFSHVKFRNCVGMDDGLADVLMSQVESVEVSGVVLAEVVYGPKILRRGFCLFTIRVEVIGEGLFVCEENFFNELDFVLFGVDNLDFSVQTDKILLVVGFDELRKEPLEFFPIFNGSKFENPTYFRTELFIHVHIKLSILHLHHPLVPLYVLCVLGHRPQQSLHALLRLLMLI